jgi:hypothetical protein
MIPSAGGNRRNFVYTSSQKQAKAFTRLFSVTITHTYYNRQKDLCSDFRIVPTAATSTIMASLGLVLKDEGTGFSVFYMPEQLHGIRAYLLRESKDPQGRTGFWSRLTFLMELVNPEFVGVTALPIQATRALTNLYGCNMQAHGDALSAILPEGEFMGSESLHERVGDEVTLALPDGAKRVTVTDISGAVVIPQAGAEDVQIVEATPFNYATLEFSVLPYGFYEIHAYDDAGAAAAPDYPRPVLYAPLDTGAMGLLDMLLTQPTPDTAGIYPLPPMFEADPDEQDCGGVAYRLPFNARSTYWRYFVVSQVPGQLKALKIEDAAGTDQTFRQQDQETLPDGSTAIPFISRSALPLRDRSPQRFRLSGTRCDPGHHENSIAVARLPVAPAAPVWPAKDQPTAGTSEMFVYV